MKRTILAAVVGTTLIAMSGTVAIIHGYPDNLFHPNVGFIAIESINGPEQKLNLKCSGTLSLRAFFSRPLNARQVLILSLTRTMAPFAIFMLVSTIRWNPTKQINNITTAFVLGGSGHNQSRVQSNP